MHNINSHTSNVEVETKIATGGYLNIQKNLLQFSVVLYSDTLLSSSSTLVKQKIL